MKETLEKGPFLHFSALFAKQPHKMDKIWSLQDGMRKFLSGKFWSHGTPLGSLGPLSFEDLGPGSCQCQIPVIWGPYEYPVLVACHVQAEKLKSVASRCASENEEWWIRNVAFSERFPLSFLAFYQYINQYTLRFGRYYYIEGCFEEH